jgi:hypothetical protein
VKRLLAALAVGLAAPLSGAAHPLPSPVIDPASQIEVAFSSDVWEAPMAVALPIRTEVRNRAPRAQRLELVFTATSIRGDSCRTRQEVLAAAQSTMTLEILVRLCPRDAARPYWNVHVWADVRGDVIAPRVQLLNRHVAPTGGWTKASSPLAVSESVATRSWEPLRVALETKGVGLLGGRFSASQLPGDWRAWAGFSGVIMTGDEWRGLEAQPRTALLGWVAAGGALFLAGENAFEGAGSRGLGRIVGLAGDGAALDVEAALPTLLALATPALDEVPDQSAGPLAERLGLRETPRLALALLMLAYAAAVGPVNLWLCRGSRRPWVFWTTPLIALAACVVLSVAIVFRDGLGGTGHRFAVIVSLPGESQELLLQEQVSRTGLLAGRAFSLRDAALLVPLPVGRTAGRRQFEVHGDRHSGDWFTSRASQGQLLQLVRPTRARLTFSPGPQGPTLVSSFPTRLRAVSYTDDEGRVWAAQDVPPGRTVRLAPSHSTTAHQAWGQQMRLPGPRLRGLLQRLGPANRNAFFAITDPGPAAPVPAGASLRWDDEPVLIVGRAR